MESNWKSLPAHYSELPLETRRLSVRFVASALISLFVAQFSFAQAPEPQYIDTPNLLVHGQLQALESVRPTPVTESHRNFVITPTTKSFLSITNLASPVRVAPDSHFVISGIPASIDPSTRIQLIKLTVGKSDREVPKLEYKQSLIPFQGSKQTKPVDNTIPLNFRPYSTASTEIMPAQVLLSGEYAFILGAHYFCFGVDAGAASSGEAYRPVAGTPAPPPKPAHPLPTDVDLPPAIAGLPPLHASRPAAENCWWTSFSASNLGFELPVEHCSTPGHDYQYSESPTGLTWTYDGATQTAFDVVTKAAGQSLEAAVKAKYFSGLRPTARAACSVKKFPDKIGPFDTYGVETLKANATCAGLEANEAVATTFLYLPSDPTHYIKFTTEDALVVLPYDLAALQFAQSGNSVTAAATPVPAASASLPAIKISSLNVRGITVRMTRAQILAAAQTANMRVSENTETSLSLMDNTATGAPAGAGTNTGTGLIISVSLKNDISINVVIREAGDTSGNLFQDIQKKWGPPKGKSRSGPFWGDPKGVYALYNDNIYGTLGLCIRILDEALNAPPPIRQAPTL